MSTTEQLDKILSRVQKLLARADHPNTPAPEAEQCRIRAEKYMAEYRIEESQLTDVDGLKAIVPVARRFPVCAQSSEFREVYRRIVWFVLHHVGGRGVFTYDYDEDGVLIQCLEAFGYDSDLRYMDALYQSARAVFASRMEPKPDPTLSDAENVYAMRSAGMERIRIAEVMGWVKGGAKVTRLYKQACQARGEDPVLTGRSMSVKDFRQAYCDGFTNELWTRLARARNAVDVTGGALVLANRKENVDELFYKAYPHLRPSDVPATTTNKPSKPFKITKADLKAWERMQGAAAQAGKTRGADAAREISIKQAGGSGYLDQ